MTSSFTIDAADGCTLSLVPLDELSTPVMPDPQFYFQPYAELVRLGDGSYRGLGAPSAEWHFPLLTLAQRNQLALFCEGASAPVYIETPNASGVFTEYLAVMRLPETEPPVKAGYLYDYVVRFENLVEQVD